jgi:hypothetical protein
LAENIWLVRKVQHIPALQTFIPNRLACVGNHAIAIILDWQDRLSEDDSFSENATKLASLLQQLGFFGVIKVMQSRGNRYCGLRVVPARELQIVILGG